jgi:predicted TPR repeat methyltransferase
VSTTRKTDDWLADAYGAQSRDDLAKLYTTWADTYDADMLSTGYLHMPVITGLIARHSPRHDSAILDAGVGTGTLGGILSILGYNNLHGLDMSEAMLTKARVRGCYSDLKLGVLGEALDYTSASFDTIVSTGTFTTGHAPAAAFDELVRILEPGGVLMFTVGTAVWEEQGFRAKLDGLVSAGKLAAVETTPIYCPMPFSETESGFTTRAHVYRRT